MSESRSGPMKKSDLQFVYADGAAAGDDPALRQLPDSALLNRNEWYEVLYSCNSWSGVSLATALKCERLIQRHLPADIHGHGAVLACLRANWAKNRPEIGQIPLAQGINDASLRCVNCVGGDIAEGL